jgi:4-oxalocrotonate tautomerase
MPHVIIKMYSGRSEQLKARLAQEVTKAVASTLKLGEDSVSVALEDVQPEDWTEQVYKPDILGRSGMIYKKPGYNPH